MIETRRAKATQVTQSDECARPAPTILTTLAKERKGNKKVESRMKEGAEAPLFASALNVPA